MNTVSRLQRPSLLDSKMAASWCPSPLPRLGFLVLQGALDSFRSLHTPLSFAISSLRSGSRDKSPLRRLLGWGSSVLAGDVVSVLDVRGVDLRKPLTSVARVTPFLGLLIVSTIRKQMGGEGEGVLGRLTQVSCVCRIIKSNNKNPEPY